MQRSLTVRAEPKQWSALVNVPRGKGGKFTFSLGRVVAEMNGVVLGPFWLIAV